jgi:hypothetical protein
MSKGSRDRTTDRKRYGENYDKIDWSDKDPSKIHNRILSAMKNSHLTKPRNLEGPPK